MTAHRARGSHPARTPIGGSSAVTNANRSGAALFLGQLPHEHAERDDAQAADQETEDLLRILGVPADAAQDIATARCRTSKRSPGP